MGFFVTSFSADSRRKPEIPAKTGKYREIPGELSKNKWRGYAIQVLVRVIFTYIPRYYA